MPDTCGLSPPSISGQARHVYSLQTDLGPSGTGKTGRDRPVRVPGPDGGQADRTPPRLPHSGRPPPPPACPAPLSCCRPLHLLEGSPDLHKAVSSSVGSGSHVPPRRRSLARPPSQNRPTLPVLPPHPTLFSWGLLSAPAIIPCRLSCPLPVSPLTANPQTEPRRCQAGGRSAAHPRRSVDRPRERTGAPARPPSRCPGPHPPHI